MLLRAPTTGTCAETQPTPGGSAYGRRVQGPPKRVTRYEGVLLGISWPRPRYKESMALGRQEVPSSHGQSTTGANETAAGAPRHWRTSAVSSALRPAGTASRLGYAARH